MIGSWIEEGWVREFSVVVLSVKSSLGSKSNNDELINVLLVGEVLVKVILEMLDGIHMLLDEVISSDLLEWESVVIKLPGVDGDLWVFTSLLEGLVDGDGVVVMLFIEFSGEEIELNIELLLGEGKRKWASVNEDLVVDNLISGLEGGLLFNGDSLDSGKGNKGQKSNSHVIFFIINY